MAWTRKDRQRVKSLIGVIANHHGGGTKLAEAMGLTDRRTVSNWCRRGIVPLLQVRALIAQAPPSLTVAPSQLNPDGHVLETKA